jgi:hypothetical protein
MRHEEALVYRNWAVVEVVKGGERGGKVQDDRRRSIRRLGLLLKSADL